MNDPEMTKILESLNSVTNAPTTGTASKPNTDPMLAILEGFDNVEKGITEGTEGPGAKFKKQMPGTHKMGSMSRPVKNDQKHPASEYLVGGEEGEPEDGAEVVAEYEDEEDNGDEYNEREFDTRFSQSGKDPRAEEFFGKDEVDEETIAPKQSFSDILRSIEEADKERLNRTKGEVQVKEKKKLTQNDKGTYDLAELDNLREMRTKLSSMLESIDAKISKYQD